MNEQKYNYLSILLFGLILLVFPVACRADIMVGFLIHSPLVFVLTMFLGIWIIETTVLVKRLLSPRQALFGVLLANIITTLIGYILIYFEFFQNIIGKLKLNIDSLDKILILFLIYTGFAIITALIEALILRLLYSQVSFSKFFMVSLRMNIYSYIFIALLLFGELMVIGGPIILITVIPYFIFKSLGLLTKDKAVNKGQKTWYIIIAAILAVVILSASFYLVLHETKENNRGNKAQDAFVKTQIMQLRNIAEIIYDKDRSYNALSCEQSDAKQLCEDIEQRLGYQPTIRANNKEYCAYIKFYKKDEWFCLDSLGNYGVDDIDPSLVGFCDGVNYRCPLKQ